MLLALYQIEHVFPGDCFIYVWILVVLDKILGWQEISTQKIEFQSLRFHQQYSVAGDRARILRFCDISTAKRCSLNSSCGDAT